MTGHRLMASVLLGCVLAAPQSLFASGPEKVKGEASAPAANATAATPRREAIKEMPLLERPNRFGHFYGNTVRRINERRSNHSSADAPVGH
jgi:hypothetical protein